VFKNLSVAALLLALAACAAPRTPPAAPLCVDDAAPLPAPAFTGKVYRIDQSQSELRVLVYRAGAMARLGHNHVLVNRALCGEGRLSDAPDGSVFWLKVPAAGFEVDDAQSRSEEGPDFAAQVSDDAKSGTLRNMLGTAVLDAQEFPVITVRGSVVTAADDASRGTARAATLIANVAITVAGHESKIDVPVAMQADSSRLTATGSVELRQSALGLTPYSLMLGALQVQDVMTIKFKMAAVAVSRGS
jgi:hypothetical protein